VVELSLIEKIASKDTAIRGNIAKLHPYFLTFAYTYGRKIFLNLLSKDKPKNKFIPQEKFHEKLWGLVFNCGLFNAAGMFKKGESYYTVAAQGAGAYLAGTTTAKAIRGNSRILINHPFVPYPFSHSASNWMGLPNPGHAAVAKVVSELVHQPGCPIGVSVAANPGVSDSEAVKGIVVGIKLYDRAGVDFIEINESCPNVPHDKLIDSSGLDAHLISRLEYISKNFIRYKERNLPLIIKLSNDTDKSLLPALIDILTDLDFDGINLGNTSTNYQEIEKMLDPRDLKAFKFFTSEFGGGVSGLPLRSKSLELAAYATEYIKTKNLQKEFHAIRTGGIETPEDIRHSNEAGILLNQWFTGYFDGFAKHGHDVYKELIY
jgi:dihydroorotate dehydrogenase